MNRKLPTLIFLFVLTGCGDPSPLKSNIEVEINQMFGTEFGVMDQVFVQHEGETIAVLGAEEFLEAIRDSSKSSQSKEGDYAIVLQTSEGMKEFSRKQTREVLSYNSQSQKLCNSSHCYTVPSAFQSEVIPK
ncbi:hypothetical protein [Alkalihalobacillus sp. CinArs1]|uniref:hypothetical protein n=1 Tax=Alkalihalobacillus sp. CinArs1 TaxID=2995314 RepID=UPI0022DCF6D7|nr:hypothetical protein [Alkalihalobacillus sp. CinArs1]